MARKRALKKRADYRKGGVVSRTKYNKGGHPHYIDKNGKGTHVKPTTQPPTKKPPTTQPPPPTKTPPSTIDGRTTTISRPGIDPTTKKFSENVFTDIEIEGGVDAPQAAATEDIDKRGTETAQTDVEEITDRTPLSKPDDIVSDDIVATTGTATDATAQDEVTASTFTGGAAGDLDSTVAATSKVTKEAEASKAALTTTQAATRDAKQEEKAKAQDIDFSEDIRSQVNPVTGVEEQVASTPEAPPTMA